MKQKKHEEEKAAYRKEREMLYEVLDTMQLEPSAKWSEKESEVNEKFSGKVGFVGEW